MAGGLRWRAAFCKASAARFIPDRFHSDPAQMVHGVHLAFIALGLLTIVSALIFNGLTSDDGSSVSQRRLEVPTI